jgi:hypothetical protein
MIRRLQWQTAILSYAAASSPLWCPPAQADAPPAISTVLDALNAVHPFSEVAMSPDGKHVVYG